MKTFKKRIAPVLLAFVMVFGVAAPTFAAGINQNPQNNVTLDQDALLAALSVAIEQAVVEAVNALEIYVPASEYVEVEPAYIDIAPLNLNLGPQHRVTLYNHVRNNVLFGIGGGASDFLLGLIGPEAISNLLTDLIMDMLNPEALIDLLEPILGPMLGDLLGGLLGVEIPSEIMSLLPDILRFLLVNDIVDAILSSDFLEDVIGQTIINILEHMDPSVLLDELFDVMAENITEYFWRDGNPISGNVGQTSLALGGAIWTTGFLAGWNVIGINIRIGTLIPRLGEFITVEDIDINAILPDMDVLIDAVVSAIFYVASEGRFDSWDTMIAYIEALIEQKIQDIIEWILAEIDNLLTPIRLEVIRIFNNALPGLNLGNDYTFIQIVNRLQEWINNVADITLETVEYWYNKINDLLTFVRELDLDLIGGQLTATLNHLLSILEWHLTVIVTEEINQILGTNLRPGMAYSEMARHIQVALNNLGAEHADAVIAALAKPRAIAELFKLDDVVRIIDKIINHFDGKLRQLGDFFIVSYDLPEIHPNTVNFHFRYYLGNGQSRAVAVPYDNIILYIDGTRVVLSERNNMVTNVVNPMQNPQSLQISRFLWSTISVFAEHPTTGQVYNYVHAR